MKRRDFILAAAAVSALPMAAQAAVEMTAYKPGLVKALLAKGETVFLDVATDWCTTCKAQERKIEALRAADISYDEAITFVRMDWDVYSRSDLAAELKIPRRSTLIVLKGDAELGRIVAGTSTKAIKDLMDTALMAATA